MKIPSNYPLVIAVLVTGLAFAACSGGQSGTITEDNVLKEEECQLMRTDIDTDDSQADVSAEDLVALARSQWSVFVKWNEQQEGQGEDHQTRLTGTLELAATTATVHQRMKTTDESICHGSVLTVAVRAQFSTEDAAFDEELSGQLSYDTNTEMTTWHAAPLPAGSFRGQLALASLATEFQNPVVLFSATFHPQMTGHVVLGEGADVEPSAGAYTIATVGPEQVESQ